MIPPPSQLHLSQTPGDTLCNIRTANTRETQKRQWETDCNRTEQSGRRRKTNQHLLSELGVNAPNCIARAKLTARERLQSHEVKHHSWFLLDTWV